MILVRLFGVLAEICATDRVTVPFEKDTDLLLEAISKKYEPFLKHKILIAVNGKLVHQTTKLTEGDEVALMPPFSGG